MKPIPKSTAAATEAAGPTKLPSQGKVQAMKQAINVAVDDGYAETKVAWFDGRTIKTHVQQSAARVGVASIAQSGGALRAYRMADSNLTLTVVEGGGDDTRTPDYPTSDLNRAVVMDALVSAGLAGNILRLGSTLPPGQFYRPNGAGINDVLIAAKQKSLLQKVVSVSGDPMPEIVDHDIFPEAISAVIDYVFDDAGNQVTKFKRPIAVVDIGGQTTDIAVVTPDLMLDATRLDSIRIGVLNVIDHLANAIIANHNLDRREVTSLGLYEALRTRQVEVGGQAFDVSDLIDEGVSQVGSQILHSIQRTIRSGADLQTVLFVGGGTALMKRVIEQYEQAVIHDSPVFANARGVLKTLTFLSD